MNKCTPVFFVLSVQQAMHSLHVSEVVVTVLIIGSALSLLTGTLQAEFVKGDGHPATHPGLNGYG